MQIKTDFPLKSLNTFGIDVRAHQYVELANEDDTLFFLNHYPLAERRHLILGGGSNLLFVNDFEGVILHPVIKGIELVRERSEYVLIRRWPGRPGMIWWPSPLTGSGEGLRISPLFRVVWAQARFKI